jgi:inosine-uridine nucleoside N-ribohydrolase
MAQYSPIEPEHDGSSEHVLVNAFKQNQNIEVLIIGPAIGISKTVRGCKISNLTFQGGFLPYSLYRPTVSLPQFEGKESIATFNFNGCRDGVAAVDDADIAVRRFVGKNVCHTIIFNKDKLSLLSKPRCEASNLYLHCMALYLEKHDEKKFHDPTALACHLYPQIGMWFRGKPVRRSGEWSTETGNDYVLADVDKEKLWDVLLNWS